ncbi:MAG: RDD family protein [Gammaproteobacteria bacterium]|nr:RDD family protein [Gammaproteobacteria bacterium]
MRARIVMLLKHLAAVVYDGLLLTAILFLATAVLLPFTGGAAIKAGNVFYFLYLVGVCFLFYGWFWTHGGQTLGLRAWKLKLVSVNGSDITWRAAGVRFLAAVLSWLLFGLGFIWRLLDREDVTLHGRLSKTKLIKLK